MIKTTNTFIILFIILFIKLNIVSATSNKNDIEVKNTNPSFQSNEYFDYHIYSFIQDNISNGPNIIYFIVKETNERIVLASSRIKDLSKPMISKGLDVSLNLMNNSKPFLEIITSKTNNGLILSGGSLDPIHENRSLLKCGGNCLEYLDLVNFSNEDDINTSSNLYHISMFYYPINKSNTSKLYEPLTNKSNGSFISLPNSKYIVIGMSFKNMDINGLNYSSFSIVVVNQLDSENTIIGKSQIHYQTEIEINPLDLNSFKYTHDKSKNVYYSLVRSNVISSNGTNELYLVIFNVESKKIESKRIHYFDGIKLDFNLVGLGAYGDKFFIVATPPSKMSYIYEFSLSSMHLIYPYNIGVNVDTYIKCENSRFLLCYSKKQQLLEYIDLHGVITKEFSISFDIQNMNKDVNILNMYASIKVDEPIKVVYKEGKSKFWLFSVIFFPVVSFIVLVLIFIFAIKLVVNKRNKNFNDLQKIEQKNEKQETNEPNDCGASVSSV